MLILLIAAAVLIVVALIARRIRTAPFRVENKWRDDR